MGTATTGRPSGLAFISGGSAVNKLAALIADRGLYASYLISVFDNGGSTGRLRRAFGGFALGDIRNRLVALARRDTLLARSILELVSYRLTGNKPQEAFQAAVKSIAEGHSELLRSIPAPSCQEISKAVSALLERLPRGFDWRDAVVGNLVLQGRYFQLGDWASALHWMHGLLGARGLVMPVTAEAAHVGARLANGRYVLGQSTITNEVNRIESPIQSVHLHPSEEYWGRLAHVKLYPGAKQELDAASAIVYTWGSFYTSVLCALLVDDLPRTIAESGVPKILMLNPLRDAETLGKTPVDLVRELSGFARGFASGKTITHVLALRPIAASGSFYTVKDRVPLERAGVDVIELECDGIPQERHLHLAIDHLVRLALTEKR